MVERADDDGARRIHLVAPLAGEPRGRARAGRSCQHENKQSESLRDKAASSHESTSDDKRTAAPGQAAKDASMSDL
jgi:hypothetical protein